MTFRRLTRNVGAMIATTALIWPAPSLAAEKGVHVDPGSPAGKEYAVPFDQARRQADGSTPAGGTNSGPGPGSSASAGTTRAPAGSQLFGQGITRVGSRARKGASGTLKGEPFGPSGAPAVVAPSEAAIRGAERSAGSGGWTWTVGIAAAVLLVGGGLALGLPRVARRREAF